MNNILSAYWNLGEFVKIIAQYQNGINERSLMKVWTIRLPDDLDRQLTERAKEEDLSKNQAIKAAVRRWLKEKKDDAS